MQFKTVSPPAVCYCRSLNYEIIGHNILFTRVLFQKRRTNQNSTTTDSEKAVTKCFKLFSYGGIEDEVNVSIDKFMPTTQTN